MKLFDNPIFLTQKRLVHRTGVIVALLLAALIGLSFLSGLIAYMSGATDFMFLSKQAAGRVFYGWVLGVEILMLPVFGLSRVSRTLSDDRKSGMWESNRLTPMSPAQVLTGYWLGSPLRETYMGAVLAIIGLVIVLLSGAPVTLWLGSQVLVLSATLLLGLLGVLAGITTQRADTGVLMIMALVLVVPFSLSEPRLLVTNYLLPSYGIMSLFGGDQGQQGPYRDPSTEGTTFFGLGIPTIVFTLGLELIMAVFIWRAATRKIANPFQQPLLRWEAIALFGVLLAAQHGLIWESWSGHFADTYNSNGDVGDILPMVQIGTILLGMALLAVTGAQPERVRLEALRTRAGTLRLVFSRSAVSLSLAFSALAGIFMLTQCVFSLASAGEVYAIAVFNLLNYFLIFTMLVECCRLRFRQRSAGFVGLGLFVLCILPFIMAGVFSNEAFGRISLLAPGTLALSEPGRKDLDFLLFIDLAHFGIAAVLFIIWQGQWKRLLARAEPEKMPLVPPILTPE